MVTRRTKNRALAGCDDAGHRRCGADAAIDNFGATILSPTSVAGWAFTEFWKMRFPMSPVRPCRDLGLVVPLRLTPEQTRVHFIDARERWLLTCLACGLLLTASAIGVLPLSFA